MCARASGAGALSQVYELLKPKYIPPRPPAPGNSFRDANRFWNYMSNFVYKWSLRGATESITRRINDCNWNDPRIRTEERLLAAARRPLIALGKRRIKINFGSSRVRFGDGGTRPRPENDRHKSADSSSAPFRVRPEPVRRRRDGGRPPPPEPHSG